MSFYAHMPPCRLDDTQPIPVYVQVRPPAGTSVKMAATVLLIVLLFGVVHLVAQLTQPLNPPTRHALVYTHVVLYSHGYAKANGSPSST